MEFRTVVCGIVAIGIVACSSDSPTQPGSSQARAEDVVAASNSWATRAVYPGTGLFAGFAATAPNSAGQFIVYYLGGLDGFDGMEAAVKAYNVTTNSWATLTSRVGYFNTNGAGKIGSKIYFSGGYNSPEQVPGRSNAVWAFDYARDRMIRKAGLPIHAAEGVSGVIAGKLYVLPGACSTARYPDPGYCANERTRRFYRYDPAANAWVSRRSSPHFHRLGAAGVIDGKFYVAGGFTGTNPVADLDVYDPGTNSWKSLAPMPTAGGAIGTVIHGKLFVIMNVGGQLQSYAYNPGTNTWKAKVAPVRRHDGVVRVTLNGSSYLVAVGGNKSPDFTTPIESELYTP
jgi:N-acetylneuraminic acid mutarotase